MMFTETEMYKNVYSEELAHLITERQSSEQLRTAFVVLCLWPDFGSTALCHILKQIHSTQLQPGKK